MNEHAEQLWINGREILTDFRRRSVGALVGIDIERKPREVDGRIRRYAAAVGKLAVIQLDPERNPDSIYEAAWEKWLDAEDVRRRTAYVRGMTTGGDYSSELSEDFNSELGKEYRSSRMAYFHPEGYWLDNMQWFSERDQREYIADIIDDTTYQEVFILNSRLRPQSSEAFDAESR